jgi:rfaE bifunctional protein kinase chain/domain
MEKTNRPMERIIEKFKGRRICVLGDLMMDKYIWGDVARISPEAPVPVVEVRRDTSCLGGAGNVCRNLEEMGASPFVIGVVGKDPEGEWIRSNVRDSRGILTSSRPTTVKTRIVAHQQQVVRVDWEKKTPFSRSLVNKIIDLAAAEDYEGLIISDYNKGMVSRALTGALLPHLKKRGIPVFVDPKVMNFSLFSAVTLITPNHLEAGSLLHMECETDDQVIRAGRKLMARLNSEYLFIKRGNKGMMVFGTGMDTFNIPALAKEVYDVTGAGDTVIAAASLALLSGAEIREAAQIANAAAGVVVAKIGTASVSREELLRALAAFL